MDVQPTADPEIFRAECVTDQLRIFRFLDADHAELASVRFQDGNASISYDTSQERSALVFRALAMASAVKKS